LLASRAVPVPYSSIIANAKRQMSVSEITLYRLADNG
jgi:hypothetical protein